METVWGGVVVVLEYCVCVGGVWGRVGGWGGVMGVVYKVLS